jgi:hypothetical protein
MARIARPVLGQHTLLLANAANCALLDHPAGRFHLDLQDTAGTFSFSYVRNPGARYVRIEARINALGGFGTGTVTLDLTVRDGAGHSVASSSSRIPYGFKGETHYARLSVNGPIVDNQTVVVGYLDCDALDDDLTDPDWVFEFALGFAGGAELNSLHGQELPRFLVDDGATHGGIVPGSFQHDVPIDDDATTGLVRLVSTLASARLVERTYVSLAWRQQVVTATETPNVSATSYAPFAALAADAAPQTWQLTARQIATGSTAGEAIRLRFLYRFSAGAGTKTGTVRLAGNATGSPWTSGALAYTTSWTWSPWITAAIRTSPATDTLSLTGKVSASGPSLWLASLHVREHVT